MAQTIDNPVGRPESASGVHAGELVTNLSSCDRKQTVETDSDFTSIREASKPPHLSDDAKEPPGSAEEDVKATTSTTNQGRTSVKDGKCKKRTPAPRRNHSETVAISAGTAVRKDTKLALKEKLLKKKQQGNKLSMVLEESEQQLSGPTMIGNTCIGIDSLHAPGNIPNFNLLEDDSLHAPGNIPNFKLLEDDKPVPFSRKRKRQRVSSR